MAERTEAPTGKRITDARGKGQVAKSVELNAAIGLLVGVWLLQWLGKDIGNGLSRIFIQTMGDLPTGEINIEWVRHFFYFELSPIALPLFAFPVILMFVGIVVTGLQTKWNIASSRAFFDWNRVNPLNGFKRIFSINGVVETSKSLIKLVIVSWPVYTFIVENIQTILSLGLTDLSSGVSIFLNLAFSLMQRVIIWFTLLAIIDFIYQRWNYNRGLKMSKEEIKEEYKQSEGDPRNKSRIRSKQMQIARYRMMTKVPKADVIVTNPTHLAIAVKYDQSNMEAPIVLAKGAYLMAEKIVSIARQNNIPVVQNIPLARAIYRYVDIDREIPPQLYYAMAEVLAYVFRLKSNKVHY